MQLEYITPFVGSLIVALLAVWFNQSWSGKANCRRTLGNLYAEVSENLNACQHIRDWAVKDIEAESIKYEKSVTSQTTTDKEDFDPEIMLRRRLLPYPRLNSLAWNSVKGSIALDDYDIVSKLEGAYLRIDVLNQLLQKVEMTRHSIDEVSVLNSIEPWQRENLRKQFGFNTVNIVWLIENLLVPELEQAKNLLAKKLKLPSSELTN